MHLYLIRHGQTPSNVLGLLDTARPGPGLTALGEIQAARIPVSLSGTPIDTITVSTLLRTSLTASPLATARGVPIGVAEGLHEIEAGELEGLGDPDSVRRYLQTAYAWGAGELDVRMPGAESGRAFFERFDTDIDAIAATGADSAVVVSHGAAIRVWTTNRAGNVPPTFLLDHHLDNTGVAVLSGSPRSGWILENWAGTPIGGVDLADPSAPDPTGEALDSSPR